MKPLGSTSDADKLEAISKLCGDGSAALAPAIAAHLNPSKDGKVRQGAAVALGILSDPSEMDVLCGALDVQEEDIFLLRHVADALRNIADQRAVGPLMLLLVSLDKQAQKVGTSSRLEHISQSGNTDRQRFIRGMAHRSVIGALGVLRASEATQYLLSALNDREPWVSDAAIQALGELLPTAQSMLEKMALDRDLIAERRNEAIEALGASNAPEVIPTLVSVMQDPDPGVSGNAVRALGRIPDPSAFEILVDVLERGEIGLRRAAAWTLRDFGEACAIEPLRRALHSSDELLRGNAASSLTELGDPSGADIHVQMLTNAEMAIHAAEDLGMLRDSRALEPLTSMLASADEFVRAQAARGLGRLGDERSVPKLVPLLSDSERNVRLSAAAGLAMLGDLRAFETLICGLWLSGICNEEQHDAIEALSRSGDKRAVAHLVRVLRGAQRETRRFIAEAMIRLGPAAIDALLAELADARPIVRLHAAEALGRIGDGSAANSLADLASADADEDVRTAADSAHKRLSAEDHGN